MGGQTRFWLQRWLVYGLLLAGAALAENPSSRRNPVANLYRQPFQLAPLNIPHTDVNQQINAQFSPAIPLTYENLRPEQYQTQIFGSNSQPPNAEFYQFAPPSNPLEHHPLSAPSNPCGFHMQSTRKEDCEQEGAEHHPHEIHHPHQTHHPHETYNHPHEDHHRPNMPAHSQFAPAIHAPLTGAAPGPQVSGVEQQAAPPAMTANAQFEPAIFVYSVDKQPPYSRDQPSMIHRESALHSPGVSVPAKEDTVSVAVEQSPNGGSFGYAYSYPASARSSSPAAQMAPNTRADGSSPDIKSDWPPNTVAAWSTAWRGGKSAALWPPDMLTAWSTKKRTHEWPKPSGAHGVVHPQASPSAVSSGHLAQHPKQSEHLNVHVKDSPSRKP